MNSEEQALHQLPTLPVDARSAGRGNIAVSVDRGYHSRLDVHRPIMTLLGNSVSANPAVGGWSAVGCCGSCHRVEVSRRRRPLEVPCDRAERFGEHVARSRCRGDLKVDLSVGGPDHGEGFFALLRMVRQGAVGESNRSGRSSIEMIRQPASMYPTGSAADIATFAPTAGGLSAQTVSPAPRWTCQLASASHARCQTTSSLPSRRDHRSRR